MSSPGESSDPSDPAEPPSPTGSESTPGSDEEWEGFEDIVLAEPDPYFASRDRDPVHTYVEAAQRLQNTAYLDRSRTPVPVALKPAEEEWLYVYPWKLEEGWRICLNRSWTAVSWIAAWSRSERSVEEEIEERGMRTFEKRSPVSRQVAFELLRIGELREEEREILLTSDRLSGPDERLLIPAEWTPAGSFVSALELEVCISVMTALEEASRLVPEDDESEDELPPERETELELGGEPTRIRVPARGTELLTDEERARPARITFTRATGRTPGGPGQGDLFGERTPDETTLRGPAGALVDELIPVFLESAGITHRTARLTNQKIALWNESWSPLHPAPRICDLPSYGQIRLGLGEVSYYLRMEIEEEGSCQTIALQDEAG